MQRSRSTFHELNKFIKLTILSGLKYDREQLILYTVLSYYDGTDSRDNIKNMFSKYAIFGKILHRNRYKFFVRCCKYGRLNLLEKFIPEEYRLSVAIAYSNESDIYNYYTCYK